MQSRRTQPVLSAGKRAWINQIAFSFDWMKILARDYQANNKVKTTLAQLTVAFTIKSAVI